MIDQSLELCDFFFPGSFGQEEWPFRLAPECFVVAVALPLDKQQSRCNIAADFSKQNVESDGIATEFDPRTAGETGLRNQPG